jgi:hypothetical protein
MTPLRSDHSCRPLCPTAPDLLLTWLGDNCHTLLYLRITVAVTRLVHILAGCLDCLCIVLVRDSNRLLSVRLTPGPSLCLATVCLLLCHCTADVQNYSV